MKTYLEAYMERMERNHNMLMGLANELKDKGYTVFANGKTDRFVSLLHIVKDGKHIAFGFSEVPYRWYAGASIPPSREHGSGYTVKEWFDVESLPDTEEIIASMRSDYKGQKHDQSYMVLV